MNKPEGLAEVTGAPRVEACIEAVIKRFPGVSIRAQAEFFQAVHQELAPLARELEVQLEDAKDDVQRLHNEKMAFFEEKIRLERELKQCNDDWNKRYQQWGATEDRLRAEIKGLQRFKASVDEALNNGDGTYKP